ncbi:MAG: glycoside hydrolase [Fuerstiella sp.]|nr:glycoside hydrolase [Fuerstiella sp.]
MKTPVFILLLLFLTVSLVRGDDSVLPWYVNRPIVTVQKEVYKKYPRKGAGALVSVRYVGPHLERLETHSVEFRDDVYSERFTRFSSDNGKTWSPSRPLASSDVYYKGKELRETGGAGFYDRKTGLLVGVWLRQIAINGLYNCFTYSRFSRDFGQTWSMPVQLRYEAGTDFNPDDPHNARFLRSNQAYFGNNIIRHSNGTLIHVVAHANAPGDKGNASRAWKMGSVVFIGRWNPGENNYVWTPGARIEISPLHSARGLMEPAVAELKDGRLLIVWRGSTHGWTGEKATLPGRKFFSVSSDGGKTLSPPREWKYDDGTSFYSPSSIHRMIRHSQTGKLYWVGNICGTPPRGNSPRYPLVIGEIDETKAALKKTTLTAIDDRRPDQPKNIQLSNFSLLEDREKHHLELYLSILGEYPDSVYTSNSYKYKVLLNELTTDASND